MENFESEKGGIVRLSYGREEVMSMVLGGLKYTQMMNIATWDAAYCLFPKMTIWDRRMCVLGWRGGCFEDMVGICRREVKNGYVLLEVDRAVEEYGELRRRGRVADEVSWIIRFENVWGDELESDGMEKVGFMLVPE